MYYLRDVILNSMYTVKLTNKSLLMTANRLLVIVLFLNSRLNISVSFYFHFTYCENYVFWIYTIGNLIFRYGVN